MKDQTCLPRAELDRLLTKLGRETRLFYQHYADPETRCREFAMRGAAIRARALPQDEPYVFARLCALYARCNGFRSGPSERGVRRVASTTASRAEQPANSRIASVIRAIREVGSAGRLRPTG